ncbi:lambda exonuclease family protein [Rhodococcus erythropolis]|uniref:lambda exonuclease family protein n=1 Tax=Rhodococcus erythropolis TaxID=1833 RepID=UPI001BE87C00|nr:lambda exonuclease family protein [Rhodococcus erythropolis]MBT2265878.1 YqaJ viral recombinase family protein [Rhodococcus erythropolis]
MTAPTLIELPDLEQGSEEWHAQRRGIVTASVVGQLVTTKTLKPASNDVSRGLTRLLVAERITGWTDPMYVSDDMLRGIEDEPKARDKYSEHYAPVREIGFMIREDHDVKIGYSPDGLVGDDGLIEVKSRRQKKHLETILADEPPAENLGQMQCGLLVSGREWCDYISYCGGMPLWVKRVFPDQRWFDAILAAVDAFEENAAEMIRLYDERTVGLPMTERTVEMEMVI